MLLSHRYKFLFVHIAKTGGTSVRATLSPYRWRDPLYYPTWICNKISVLTGHKIGAKFPRHSKVVAAMEMLPSDYFERLFKFAFVRNPWDLQVSSFHHIRRERPHLMRGYVDFESFLKYKLDPDRPYQYHIDTSLEWQSDYLVDLHGNLRMDFIGRYESLDSDFRTVCQKIGLTNLQLAHKRKAGDRKDYRSYYTDETAELVAAHFQRDLDLLGYAFDQEVPDVS